MKIKIIFEIDDDDRRAVARHYGEEGLASRETMTTFLECEGTGGLEDVMQDYLQSMDSESEEGG